jgi:hypothetical protein
MESSNMPDDKEEDAVYLFHAKFRDYLIDAVRYHFGQFNLWTVFFVTINGSLFIAFYSNNEGWESYEKVLLFISGYFVSFLFFCCSRIYSLCIIYLSKKIDDIMNDFKNENPCYAKDTDDYRQCFYSLGYTKISTTKIIYIFSSVLMFSWGILFSLNIFKHVEIYIGMIVIISVTAYFLLLAFMILENNFKKHIKKKY